MPWKTHHTVRIQWIRSGIGFAHKQRGLVRSLGLRRLNQVVERPDTPQIRGIVAKISHLVKIVDAAAPAAISVPEYTVRPPEPSQAAQAAAEASGLAREEAATPVQEVPTSTTTSISQQIAEKPAEKPRGPSEEGERVEKARRGVPEKAKNAKAAEGKLRKKAQARIAKDKDKDKGAKSSKAAKK